MTQSTTGHSDHANQCMEFVSMSATPEQQAQSHAHEQESTLASRMAYAREMKGKIWSQKHLAEQAGVSLATIGMLESGKRGNTPRVPGTIPAIAKALSISYDWLAYGNGEMLAPAAAPSTHIDGAVSADANNLAMLIQAIEPSRRPTAVRAATQTLIGFLRPLPQQAND